MARAKPNYDFEQLRLWLTKLWLDMDQPCAKILKVSLQVRLPFTPGGVEEESSAIFWP